MAKGCLAHGNPRYRFGTRCIVLSVQIVHGTGHIGHAGRSGTDLHESPAGWGPKGRWFKSSRPDCSLVIAVFWRVKRRWFMAGLPRLGSLARHETPV
jgi:hypothetical protein